MDLKYLETEPGDVILPPYGDDKYEYATLVYYEDEYYNIALDSEDCTTINIHESQLDDLIVALKTVRENQR